MIDLRKIKYNVILGILVGIFLSQMILVEGYAILSQKQQSYYMIGTNGVNRETLIIKFCAFIVFILSIIIFNTKRFRKINFDKLSIYLILVILISLFVSFEGTLFICAIPVKIWPDIINYLENSFFISANMLYVIVFIAVGLFLTTFILLLNRKVKYIKYLTTEVKNIKKEGFGKTIEVRGGDELAELCKSINNMSVELGQKIENEKKIEQNKNELITNISHDLKTPLTSIIGYLEILNSKDLDEFLKSEYVSIAYNKSLRLKSLVNELFEYTKLSGSDMKLEKHKVNISMLLNQAVGENILSFSEKNIDVVLDNKYDKAFVNIDAAQMLRVFENLIRNAEKYSDPNSKFKVSLNVNNGKIEISFSNRCESITEEELVRFFERFYRVDKSRNKEGTGLGLAIVKRIVELHEGIITAQKDKEYIKFNIILNEA